MSEVESTFKLPEKLVPMRKHLTEFTAFAQPCVYFLLDGDDVVYVGQSVSLQTRIISHKKDKKFDRVVYISCDRERLDEVEGTFIRALKPKFNGKCGVSAVIPEFILMHFNALHLAWREMPPAIAHFLETGRLM